MHRPLCLLLVLLALAGAAQAQQAGRSSVRRPDSAGLRGPILSGDPASQASPAAAGLRSTARDPVIYGAQSAILPLPPVSSGVGGTAQQCRMSCARTYYFCLAGNQGDDCATSWSQCRAGCNADPLSSTY